MTHRDPRIVLTVLVLVGVATAGGLVAADKAAKVTAAPAGAAEASRFQQLSAQARSAKAPGGSPDTESKAFLSQLTKKYTKSLESENARAKARFGVAAPRVGVSKPALGVLSPGSKPEPASGESASGEGQKVAPDPCGSAFELKAISAAPPLDPGEAVMLEGCGFGPNPPGGEVRLVGDFPGGHLKLRVDGWTPTKILAYVSMVTGVPDMPAAKIQVFRHDGKFTNWLDVGFRAAREVVLLRPSDVSVACSELPHTCGMATSFPHAERSFFEGATYAGKHDHREGGECAGANDGLLGTQAAGEDTVTVGLRNGWLLAGYIWWWSYGGSGYVFAPAGFAPDTASSTIKMRWGLESNHCFSWLKTSTARYRVDLYAYGPKGVPYK